MYITPRYGSLTQRQKILPAGIAAAFLNREIKLAEIYKVLLILTEGF